MVTATAPKVTLIVAMRNEARHIEACLASIVAQRYDPSRLEVLVYDGGSDDGSTDLARRFTDRHAGWRLIPNPRGIQAAGWNAGIGEASGDIIGIVSGHAELAPTYVTAAVEALRRSGADMVGGPVRAVGVGRMGQAVAVATSTPFGVGGAGHHYATEARTVDTVFMGLCWADTYRRFPFDERFVRNQDDELSYRLLDAGGTIVCDPTIESRYWARASLADLWRQYFAYGRWKVQVLRAHPRQARARHLAPATLCVILGGGALAAALVPALWPPVAFTAATYAAAVTAAAVVYGRSGGPAFVAALMATYPTLHLAYGGGMLRGIVDLRPDQQSQAGVKNR